VVGLVEVTMGRPWVVFLLCAFAGFFLTAANTAHSPTLTLIMKDLNLNYTEGGLLTTAYFVGYALGQIPWGYLADRFKTGKVIALSTLGASIFTLLFGGATQGLEAILWRFLMGLLGAGIFVPGVRMVSDWFPSEKRGTAIGFFGAASSLGPIFSAPISSLIAAAYGWRWSIWFFMVLGLPSFFLSWTLLKEREESKLNRGESFKDDRGMLEQKSFWILGFDQFVRLGAIYALLFWLPTFLLETYGIDRFWSSLSVVAMNTVGIFSNAVGGLISDRIGEKAVIISSLTALIPAFYLLAALKDQIAVWTLVIIFGWFLNFVRGPIFAILPKLYGVQRAGRASGYQNTFAATGALVLPFILGYTRDYTASFDVGWMSLTLFCGAASIVTTFLRGSENSIEKEKGRRSH